MRTSLELGLLLFVNGISRLLRLLVLLLFIALGFGLVPVVAAV